MIDGSADILVAVEEALLKRMQTADSGTAVLDSASLATQQVENVSMKSDGWDWQNDTMSATRSLYSNYLGQYEYGVLGREMAVVVVAEVVVQAIHLRMLGVPVAMSTTCLSAAGYATDL